MEKERRFQLKPSCKHAGPGFLSAGPVINIDRLGENSEYEFFFFDIKDDGKRATSLLLG